MESRKGGTRNLRMMKLGTPVAVDGPGSTSVKLGFDDVGVPSGLRRGERRPRRFAFEISRLARALTSPVRSRLLPVCSWTRRPELERSCSDPPPELGLSPPPGAGAGALVVGGGFGALGTVGVVGAVGVGADGGVTTGPGSWMSSSVAPGGTSTVTGTTSPLASRTYTVWV